jgi:hypothetical protein
MPRSVLSKAILLTIVDSTKLVIRGPQATADPADVGAAPVSDVAHSLRLTMPIGFGAKVWGGRSELW